MKIKAGRRTMRFEPDEVSWMTQSSLHSHFGFWESNGQRLFVKRSAVRPPGWGLLERSVKRPIPNAPAVFDLKREEGYFYLFMEKLEGDVFLHILQNNQAPLYFSKPALDTEDRLKIFLTVYGTIKRLNAQGYWYPDLDFKNLFIAKPKIGTEYGVFLIDLDSCARHGEPFKPDHVSQTYWEGMVKTCHRLGGKFVDRRDPAHPCVIPNGRHLNQSMLILFAYSLQRLGFVPKETSLYDPLVHPRNPHSRWILQTHEKLAQGNDCWEDIEAFLPAFFKIPRNRFQTYFEKYAGQEKKPGISSLLAAGFHKVKSKLFKT
ncbi:MAG: hypothetical protein HY580_00745 [Nitrospinae bacterium]|nr:hypothetical protein [Nitrospinota bacterium]